MPCLPIPSGFRRYGILCVGNEPVSVEFKGRTYQFEWTHWCGWAAVNRDGSERLSPVPKGAWDALLAQEEGETDD